MNTPLFYYVYIITNNIDNTQYVGSKMCYVRDPYNDNYFGTSKYLNKDILKYGKENFDKKLFVFVSINQTCLIKKLFIF